MRDATIRLLLGASLLSCAGKPAPATEPIPQTGLDRTIAALVPAKLSTSDAARKIDTALATHFERFATRRGYLMTDKPLYQPGETIWVRADLRATGTLVGATPTGAQLQLISPRGAIVTGKRVQVTNGVGMNDFVLDAAIEGGEYTLQLTADDGTTDQKKLIVNTYQAPRLKKSVELLKKSYGAGDTVAAAVEIARTTGEPYADRAATGIVTVDDVEIARLPLHTDREGKVTVRFELPKTIARGDGLLTILADDGGVTESIQKRIPIVMSTLAFEMFPEGGDLIDGLPNRVYFAAKTTLGKPADIEGRIVDDRGTVVGDLASIHAGMGRFELQPATDRSYHVELTRPAGITAKFAVPAAKSGGCVVRSVNARTPDTLRVAAVCTTARTVIVEAALREKRIGGGEVAVAANAPTLVELPIDANAQGAVRVTLFSQNQEPLAERLVYHGRGQDLAITMTADRKSYSPRDPVKLAITAVDAHGKPVKASLGVAVVDDTVLAFADDKSGKILAHYYLEDELGANPADPASVIDEPNFYFGKKPEAVAAMDALLATRGYRRFAWQQVFSPPPPAPPVYPSAGMWDDEDGAPDIAMARGRGERPMAPPMAPPMANAAPRDAVKAAEPEAKAKAKEPPRQELARRDLAVNGIAAHRMVRGGDDGIVDGDLQQQQGWAAVRVFPVPAYTKGYSGPRTDFRETIYWNANVQTDASGHAEVAFVASDAVTSYRATAEGVSTTGMLGGGEAVFSAKMPVSIDAHLPVEVTQGDAMRLPVTITNETDGPLDADLGATFGAAFKLASANPAGKIHLNAHEAVSRFFPLDVVATAGSADVELTIDTAGLHDSIKKAIRVVPLGFPFEATASGTVTGDAAAKHHVSLAGALPGSIQATVTMYPSPLASMTQGMAQMIREPGGCFEQTSSTNYPNIMILGYLEQSDGANAALADKTRGVLDRGYKLLTGYETKQQGYEWFGKTPGHEALTAYGLMEFADMAKVYDVDRAMVERTAAWLMARRDGKGGFTRSSEALDSFGRASETTTNAYIMWALSEAGRVTGLDKELAAVRTLGETSKDPYLLALATSTATTAKQPGAAAMAKRLVELQAKDGSFPGAKESITMSGGESLTVEATSLAVLAMIKASGKDSVYEPQIRGAVDYLNAHRSNGGWNNTQSTILGLKALTAYTEHARQMTADGKATLVINGKPIGTIAFDKGRKDALVWDGADLASALIAGDNQIEVRLDSTASLPYTIAIEYRSARPQSSPDTKVAVTTALDHTRVKLGEGVKLRAHVANTTKDGIPMTLARIGIPGGLVFQSWQLKELRDKGAIDFYETRPREVILYWRGMAPSQKHDISLDLLAAVPGTYEAPASSAYLYYTAEQKAWTAPVKVTVEK